VGYASTLPFVGNPLADLPSGERQEKVVGCCMCRIDDNTFDDQYGLWHA
jgi:hypothetical protein